MAFPEEIGQYGKPCPDCKVELNLQVLRSAAGYYIGTWCDCGPYSRESGYYKTHKEAEEALAKEQFGRPL